MQIDVRNLVRRFGRTTALADVSFVVPSGKVFGFIGPNGAGKTTAIGIMAGIDAPQSGDVLYDGVSMIQHPERFRKHVGFMPDSIPDSKDTTVSEYLDFYVRAFGMGRAAGQEALRRVRKFARLETLDHKFLAALSKGMKQQVSLARILLHDPSILLLDEPAAGLDPRARIELGEAVKRLAESGKTILISSHILNELNEICDGVVVIEKGLVTHSGMLSDISGGCNLESKSSLVLTFADGVTAEAQVETLKKIAPDAEISRNGRDIILITDNEEQERGIITKLVGAGSPVAVIRRTRIMPAMQDLFLQTTKGDVQ